MIDLEKKMEKKKIQKIQFGVHQKIENKDVIEKFLENILQDIPKSAKQLEKVKNSFAAEHNIPTIKNRDIIGVARKNKKVLPVELQKLIQKRAVRTISGVSPIGVLTKPFACPGKCIYCPAEDRMPKSYMKTQPAAARALRNNFDPFFQVKNRIISLEESGHPVSKLELIVMGGTWSFLPRHYQEWYITHLFLAANSVDDPEKFSYSPENFPQELGYEENIHLIAGKKEGEIIDISEENLKIACVSTSEELQKYHSILKNEVIEHHHPEIKYNENHPDQLREDALKIVFFQKSEIVGAAFLLPKSKKTIQLAIFGITKKYQKNGLGTHFLRFLEEFLLNKGVTEIVCNSNEKSFAFYEKNNFIKNFWIPDIKPMSGTISYGKKLDQKILENFSEMLQQQQKINETASHRIIGLTLETRPDFITEKELIRMRKYGCTRIEIGVQTLHDEVQKITKRGHDKKSVIRAMKLMKDFGFKVCFHLMPGLPGSSPEKDLEMMKEIFENPDFRPDFIKIYPCMVLPTSDLENIWKNGGFTPISDQELIQLLLKFKMYVPEWTRIMRFMRDIPAGNILDGSKFSNLRQILQEQPKKLREIVGEKFYKEHNLEQNASKLFRDIRSREVGFFDKISEMPVLKRRDYEASKGKEVFLSFESEDESQLFALLRLRKPSKNSVQNISDSEFSELFTNTAFIREVHSYGTEKSVGEGSGSGQHRGLGRKLIAEAEKIAKEEWNLQKITIIAGIGTREYYRKVGYEEKLSYMVKNL